MQTRGNIERFGKRFDTYIIWACIIVVIVAMLQNIPAGGFGSMWRLLVLVLGIVLLAILGLYLSERERQLARQLYLASITDGLTGLYNHSYFIERLSERIASREPFYLVFADIDYFKRYNDTEGHFAGDKLLTQAASSLKRIVGDDYDIYRYGGDEFAIILPEKSAEEMDALVRRLESEFESDIGVSISVGYARYSDGLSVEQFVKKADSAMYARKARKRGETS